MIAFAQNINYIGFERSFHCICRLQVSTLNRLVTNGCEPAMWTHLGNRVNPPFHEWWLNWKEANKKQKKKHASTIIRLWAFKSSGRYHFRSRSIWSETIDGTKFLIAKNKSKHAHSPIEMQTKFFNWQTKHELC